MKLFFELLNTKNNLECSKNLSDIICRNLPILCMGKKLLISEKFAWSPEPEENPVGRIPVKEGKNLPNSPEEDVGNFLLAPTYSSKQLRRINRLQLGKIKDQRKKIRLQEMRDHND
jgi:hypothetical protein